MEVYIILALVAVFAMLFVGYWLGGKVKAGAAAQMVENLQAQLAQHIENEKRLEQTVQAQTAQMASLTSERDVQKAHTENYCRQLAEQKENAERQLADQKAEFERQCLSRRQLLLRRHSWRQSIMRRRLPICARRTTSS